MLAVKSENTPIRHLPLRGLDATSAEKLIRDNGLEEIEIVRHSLTAIKETRPG